jgi:hypothetical protein
MDDAVDLTREPEQNSRLKCLNGVTTHDGTRPRQFDFPQLCPSSTQRLDRDFDARRDSAAQILTFGRNGIERRGSAKVNDDRWSAELRGGRKRIDDPVAADFLRVVGQNGDACAHSWLDHDNGDITVITRAHQSHLVQCRRNGRTQGNAGNADVSGLGALTN